MNENSVASDSRKLAQKSPINQNMGEEAKENAFKCNTELKLPAKNPPKVTVTTEDGENEFSAYKEDKFA